MIEVYPADSRYHAENEWLRSNFSFSFGPYYDPENTHFGPMRVLNDDFIAPEKGFGAHPHSDMEVVSIVLQGKLKHQDNLGNVGITSWGEIQRMTAGTGIIHTEFSASTDEELNLLQLWFEPEERGLNPSYEITRFDTESLAKRWTPVVSNHASHHALHHASHHVGKVHQDMTIYLGQMASGETRSYETSTSRRMFLFVINGEVLVNDGTELHDRDSVRITDLSTLDVHATAPSRLMLIDLP
ncbi:pirin family protein [Alicyclobacillus fastidiosus]|uniref:Pirin family protein n=1 Tax=Alicyclobacillus fastidiosus TaxID=392011 RepID=A0ABY6ZG54_9BACL|nr:pirin family protein [Alicyclobacillus fastidiosus]WAH41090.1 pirin family protein [Alicyclobacillus fastidiosus]GMA62644.1 quercetin 2,3-dioxygenase [Alicyclobacillus fastidiosus]